MTDQPELFESLLGALANDERVLSASERELVQSIVAEVSAAHGPAAGQTVVGALGRVIGQRLVGQLGQGVAQRVVGDRSAVPADQRAPGFEGPPVGPPPFLPDPAPGPFQPAPAPVPAPTPAPAPVPEPPLPPVVPIGPIIPPFPPLPPVGPFEPLPPPTPPVNPPPIYPPFGVPPPIVAPPGPIFPAWPSGPGPHPWFAPEGGVPAPDVAPELVDPKLVAPFPDSTSGERVIPAQVVRLDDLLDENELADAVGWARDHDADFVEETVVTPSDELATAARRTVRVLSDLGNHGPRIAERIRQRLYGAEGDEAPDAGAHLLESPRLSIVEVATDRTLDLRSLVWGSGISVVVFLTEPDPGRSFNICGARSVGGAVVHGDDTESVETQVNSAIVFPAPLSSSWEPAGDDTPDETTPGGLMLAVIGHLGVS